MNLFLEIALRLYCDQGVIWLSLTSNSNIFLPEHLSYLEIESYLGGMECRQDPPYWTLPAKDRLCSIWMCVCAWTLKWVCWGWNPWPCAQEAQVLMLTIRPLGLFSLFRRFGWRSSCWLCRNYGEASGWWFCSEPRGRTGMSGHWPGLQFSVVVVSLCCFCWDLHDWHEVINWVWPNDILIL